MTEPDPLAELARVARRLAEAADYYATLTPAELAPGEQHDGERTDPLALLDKLAAQLPTLTAATRRHTWQQLRAEGYSDAAIGKAWGVTRQHVGRVAGPRPPRARLGAPTTTAQEGA